MLDDLDARIFAAANLLKPIVCGLIIYNDYFVGSLLLCEYRGKSPDND
jgi:hypothetical protein